MNKNVGKIDKWIRIILGIIVIAIGLYFQSWWCALGLIPIATGLINWCPLYLPFGLSTRKSED